MNGLRVAVALALAAFIAATAVPAQERPAAAPDRVPRDTFEGWMAALSNAGRWGANDELGTLNLITPEKRRRAAEGVRAGISVSLAHELAPGPDPNAMAPMELRHSVHSTDSPVTWAIDEIRLVYHGWVYSHVDALSHALYRGQMYNGYGREHLTPAGAQRLGVQAMQAGIVTRGVLIDVPRLKGVPYLEPGTPIIVTDLEQWERRRGVRVAAGDVLLIRTGRWARAEALGPWEIAKGTAGPHPSIAAWLKARGVAALGSDVANEVYPSVVPGIGEPLHQLALVALGMPLLDNLDLDALAAEAAARSRYTFLFVAAPLRVRGGSGSPLNPLAIF
jgi:kynurenine formamidase